MLEATMQVFIEEVLRQINTATDKNFTFLFTTNVADFKFLSQFVNFYLKIFNFMLLPSVKNTDK